MPKPTKKPRRKADSGRAFARQMRREHEGAVAAQAAGLVGGALVGAAYEAAALNARELTDNIPLDSQLFSVGYVSQLLGLPPAAVRELMRRAGVPWKLMVNDVPHLDGEGLRKLYRALPGEEQPDPA